MRTENEPTKLHRLPPELELVELEEVGLQELVPEGGQHPPLLRSRLT